MADILKNYAISAVATAPSPATSGTSLVVTAGHGSRFPTPPFSVTVCPANTAPTPANAEIVRVTGVSTDTLTITRTAESTSARTIVVGDQIFQALTAATLQSALALADNLVSGTNLVEQRNSTNAQAFRVYSTYTDASNYERFQISWDAGNSAYDVGSMFAGTGSNRSILFYGTQVQFWKARDFAELARIKLGTVLFSHVELDGTAADGIFSIADESGVSGVSIQLREMTAPGTPPANSVRIYAEDDGAGKTRTVIKYPSGAVKIISTDD